MYQLRNHPRLLDLIDDPVPVANRLYRHGGSCLPGGKKLLDRTPLILDARVTKYRARVLFHRL